MIKVSKINRVIKNSFNLSLVLFTQEIIQIGIMNVVKTMNNIEIPSTPNLNFM